MIIEGFQIPSGIQPVNPVPVDAWSGPYVSVDEALSTIPFNVRYLTMIVRILSTDESGNKLYWFKDGVNDSDLIAFSSEYEGGVLDGDIIISEGHSISGDGSGLTGLTIGVAEDLTYDDGIFKDLYPTTKIGVVVDRFNEMFLKLAPTPPTEWNLAALNISSTNYQARKIITSEIVNITIDSTPYFQVNIGTSGLSGAEEGVLSFSVDNIEYETYDVNLATSKNDNVIRYVYGDPYVGQSAKSGFWVGFTSLGSQSPQLLASSFLKTATYNHSLKGALTRWFYLDLPLTTSVELVSANVPNMSGYVSGIKTLTIGQNISNINFNVRNVSSYFYSNEPVWNIYGDLVFSQNGDCDNVPTFYGENGIVTDRSTSIKNSVFSNDNVNFSVRARNSIGVYGSVGVFQDNTKRVDTVSSEIQRLTSGSGLYPTDYGSAFNSSLSLSENLNELMLLNGYYKLPSGDYSGFGSPNYNGITTGDNINGVHYRWATFIVGEKINYVNNVTIRIPNANIGNSWNAIKMYVKIGDSGWLDATTSQSVQNPYSDGDSALNISSSPGYGMRVITFGTIPRNGIVYVRIGIKLTDVMFTFQKPTMD